MQGQLLLTAAPGVQEWADFIDRLEDRFGDSLPDDVRAACEYSEAPERGEKVNWRSRGGDYHSAYNYISGGNFSYSSEFAAEFLSEELNLVLLGHGNFSGVYECPWDDTKAIKIGMGGEADGDIYNDGYLTYVLYCLKRQRENRPNILLPTIHKVFVHDAQNYFIVLLDKYDSTMESFDSDNPEHKSVLNKYNTLMHIIRNYNKPKNLRVKIARAAQELLNDPTFIRINDLHGGNLMVHQGNIIITDPSASHDVSTPEMRIRLRELGVLPYDEDADTRDRITLLRDRADNKIRTRKDRNPNFDPWETKPVFCVNEHGDIIGKRRLSYYHSESWENLIGNPIKLLRSTPSETVTHCHIVNGKIIIDEPVLRFFDSVKVA